MNAKTLAAAITFAGATAATIAFDVVGINGWAAIAYLLFVASAAYLLNAWISLDPMADACFGAWAYALGLLVMVVVGQFDLPVALAMVGAVPALGSIIEDFHYQAHVRQRAREQRRPRVIGDATVRF